MAIGRKTGGRAKGVPNKATRDVREAMAQFAQGNADKFVEWIERVALNDPAKAADLYLRAIEFHVPKLARSEVSGPEGGAQEHVFRWEP